MKKILVIGATSAIGQELVKLVSGEGDLLLVGRDEEKLSAVASDARTRGEGEVASKVVDLAKEEDLRALEAWILEQGEISEAFLLPGILSNEEASLEEWERDMKVNWLAPCYLSRLLCEVMAKGAGALMVVGSVAGDRGRQSNGLYGAQKKGLETYLMALRHRMFGRGSQLAIALVKPGFVNTPMTREVAKNRLFSEPEKIARGMLKIAERRKSGVFYLPSWWRAILLVVKSLPDFVFLRTKL